MRCTLPGRNIKLFGKAVHCLSKIGDELYIEGLQDKLTLRTVNSSRSAYGCFHFSEAFFVEYEHQSHGHRGQENDGGVDNVKVKIPMKSCLGVFKSLSNLEKIVDHCRIEYDEPESRLVFTLSCKHGIVKTHNLVFQECESLQAIFAKELCQNMIRSPARVFQDCVANFPGSCEEISVSVCPQSIKFKNYVEEESELARVVHTEMTLSPEEFEDCRIGIDTEITFCLKELRAILAFSESVNQPVNVHFETSGRPIVFSMDGDSTFTADFVLASLMDSPPESQATQATQSRSAVDVPKRVDSRSYSQKQNGSSSKRNGLSSFRDTADGITLEAESEGTATTKRAQIRNKDLRQGKASQNNRSGVRNEDGNENEERQALSQGERGTGIPQDDFFSQSFPYKEMFTGNGGSQRKDHDANSQDLTRSHVLSSGRSSRPISTPRSSQACPNISKVSLPKVGDSCPLEDSIVVEEEDDCIPGTPPAKRHKSMLFAGESEQTEEREEERMVLAADTDEED